MSNLAFAYRKHFSEDDIDSMDVFFRMEAAQIWLESPDQLNELQKNKVNAFLESDTGKKIVSKDKALRKDMDEIASHWKRELFAEKLMDWGNLLFVGLVMILLLNKFLMW